MCQTKGSFNFNKKEDQLHSNDIVLFVFSFENIKFEEKERKHKNKCSCQTDMSNKH